MSCITFLVQSMPNLLQRNTSILLLLLFVVVLVDTVLLLYLLFVAIDVIRQKKVLMDLTMKWTVARSGRKVPILT